MGYGKFDDSKWTAYKTSRGHTASTPVHQVYSSRSMDPSLNPHGIKGRESCDSPDNPNSHAIIVALDVTGSMGFIADIMQKQGLKTFMTEVYARKPIPDPHLMFMAIGDADCIPPDQAPLQITQFEADERIAEQLEKIWLEHGGGGNKHESYSLPWYFAARHTTIDCFEKRGEKGFLFTIGDEFPQPILKKTVLKKVLGVTSQVDFTTEEMLAEVEKKWHVFHIMVAEGNQARMVPDETKQRWTKLLGQRAIWLSDHTKLAEVLVSVLQIHSGVDPATVATSWDAQTAAVVKTATAGLGTVAAHP